MNLTLELTPDEMIVLRYLLVDLHGEPLKDIGDCEEFRRLDRKEMWRRADAALEALKRKVLGDS